LNIKKIIRFTSFLIPPIFKKIRSKIYEKNLVKILPPLTEDLSKLVLSEHCLNKLIKDFEFTTVLDIGSGAGAHAKILASHGKKVTAIDFGNSIYAQNKGDNYQNIDHIEADFIQYKTDQKYDCIWASHVLEHQNNPGEFISKCIELVKEDGIIAITVPPMEENVLGGHLTNWNAGILIYNLVFNGIDCSDCSILSHGYNISVIVKNRKRGQVDLTHDNGDISKLLQYFPSCINTEPFDGRINKWNW